MIPASLSPSGRASASPPPTTNWNAAKLPNSVKYGKTTTKSEHPTGKTASTQTLTGSSNRQRPAQPQPQADTSATTTATPPSPLPSTNSPQNPLNVSAKTFLPSRPAQHNQTGTTQVPRPSSPTTAQPAAAVYSASDIRSDPSYWTTPPISVSTDQRTSASASTSTGPRNNAASAANENEMEIGYTSPYTGLTMTRKDLREYSSGKQVRQDDGSVVHVFFKPGFLATREELWGRWTNSP